ncbi:MAG: hypothetical protein ACTSV8_02760, partial [Candidatus Thorarchaeota archaeon]
ISWVPGEVMIAIWVAMVVAYTIIAAIEELHLTSTFKDQYTAYRKRSGFIYPIPTGGRLLADVLITIVVSVVLLLLWTEVSLASFGALHSGTAWGRT